MGLRSPNGSPLRKLRRVPKCDLRRSLVKEYLSRDANGLVSQRDFWRPEFLPVAPKDNRSEDLIGVRLAKVQEGWRSRGLGSISGGGDHPTNGSILTDVTRCFLRLEGSRMGRG